MNTHEIISSLACPKCHSPMTATMSSFLQCASDCGPVPVLHDVPRFYGLTEPNEPLPENEIIKTPERWTRWRKLNFTFFSKELERTDKGGVLVDIGAGPSPFSNLLSTFKVIALDFKPFHGVHVVTDLTRSLPIQSNSADVVISSNFLEHIPNPEEHLKEVHRILKPGGKLLLAVPFLIKIHQAPYDFSRYTEFMLRHLHQNAGFRKTSIESMGNIFDVQDNLRTSAKKLLLDVAQRNRFVTFAVKAYFKIVRILEHALWLIIGNQHRSTPDAIGYPQGYGVVAEK